MPIRFVALETDLVRHLQNSGVDANGHAPERQISDGNNIPCRHCLTDVAAGKAYLILAHRPFPEPQPYAEQGPIFLHAEPCARRPESTELPPILDSPRYIVRGYDDRDRIVYGSGRISETDDIVAEVEKMFEDPRITYAHVRSATNNCYQCRIERA